MRERVDLESDALYFISEEEIEESDTGSQQGWKSGGHRNIERGFPRG